MGKRWDVMSARPKRDSGVFWHRVGTAFEGQKGINVVFDSLPIPDADGRISVSLFEPRERGEVQQSAQPRQQSSRGGGGGQQYREQDLDDEVPFASFDDPLPRRVM